MVSRPSTTVMARRHSTSQAPKAPESAPSETKTAAKPSTKSSDPASIRPRWEAAAPSASSAPDNPVA